MQPIKNSRYCQYVTMGELPCLHIEHPDFFAEICLQGAQLTQFSHHKLGEFLWLSETADYKNGQSLRGGVPICWPWFGVLDKNPDAVANVVLNNKVAHGFARTQLWQLDSIKENEHCVRIECVLKDNPHTQSIWPFAFELRCVFDFGKALSIELTTTNTSEKPFHFSQALHTYLGVSDIAHTRITGGDAHDYIDALDDWKTKPQQGDIKINQEIDRIYLGKIDYTLLDNAHSTTLKSNSHSSVVWNPWVEKSQCLSQFKHDAYKNMVCIENGNILDDSVYLEKGARHTLTMTLNKKRIS